MLTSILDLGRAKSELGPPIRVETRKVGRSWTVNSKRAQRSLVQAKCPGQVIGVALRCGQRSLSFGKVGHRVCMTGFDANEHWKEAGRSRGFSPEESISPRAAPVPSNRNPQDEMPRRGDQAVDAVGAEFVLFAGPEWPLPRRCLRTWHHPLLGSTKR